MSLLLVAFFCCTLPLKAQHSHLHSENYSRAKVHFDAGHNLEDLQLLGVAVDHGYFKKGIWFESDFSEHELELIEAAGFNLEIEIEDVSRHYRDQQAVERLPNVCAPDAFMRIPSDYTIPADFTLGSMGGFYTLDEVMQKLDTLAAKYPNIVSPRMQVGSQLTHEGRTMYMVKISDNVSVDEGSEPNVLYTSLMHAREPAGMSTVIFYMMWICENYGSDPVANYIVNNTQMYFVPVVNPDGYEINRTGFPGGGGLWRKNARPNGGSTGVDLNRNWAYNWGYDNIGSSTSGSSDTYRGPSPASEPEIQNMEELAIDRNFRTALNYHSFGDLLVFPWGYIGGLDSRTPDHQIFKKGSERMVVDNAYLWGTAVSTVGYTANGVSDDWFYGDTLSGKDKTFAWTPEVGPWFWPSSGQIPSLAQENVYMNLFLAYAATRYSVVTALAPDLIAARKGQIPLEVSAVGLESVSPRLRIRPLTDNILFDDVEFSLPAMEQGETSSIKADYQISTATKPGERVAYEVEISWDAASFRKTYEHLFGAREMISAPALMASNWRNSSNGWTSLGEGRFHTQSSEEYRNNAEYVLPLGRYDLSASGAAKLSFEADWDIERRFDYATVEIRSQEVSEWTALCGRLTHPSTKLDGLPVYDGTVTGAREQIDLSDWIGQEVELRIRMLTDEAVTAGGMEVRNVQLRSVDQTLAGSLTQAQIEVYPNPASDQLNLNLSGAEAMTFELVDAMGRVQRVFNVQCSEKVSLQALPAGLYQLRSLEEPTLTEAIRVIR